MADEPKKDARATLRDIESAVRDVADRTGEAMRKAGEQLSGMLSGTGSAPASVVVPEQRPLRPLRSGEEVEARVRLANATDTASEPFGFTASDLVADGGEQIPAASVDLPSHQRVVAAHQSDTVAVKVTVPEGTAPGIYRGELRPSVDTVAAVPLEVHVQ